MRGPVLTGVLLIAVSVLPACRRGAPPPAGPTAPAPSPLALPADALVYYDNGGGIQDSARLVVRDDAALREVWARATSTQSAPPPPPAVDFAREMVIVAAAGRMTPEDLIRVDSLVVREENGAGQRTMEVVVRTVEGCERFRSDAYPLAIVRVQRFDGPVRFVERRERAEGCASAAGQVRRRPLRGGR